MTSLTAGYDPCMILSRKPPAPVPERMDWTPIRCITMSRRFSFARALPLALLLAAVASCGSDRATSPTPPSQLLGLPILGSGSGSPTLLQCDPPAAADSVTALIGPLGGTLALGNTRVVIPENAVLSLTPFKLKVPASRLVEISVRGGDAEHFLFLQPVLVQIDYGRCAGSLGLLKPISVWHIDESSKALLENMGGTDLRLLHTISFYTGHLSGYAVAE